MSAWMAFPCFPKELRGLGSHSLHSQCLLGQAGLGDTSFQPHGTTSLTRNQGKREPRCHRHLLQGSPRLRGARLLFPRASSHLCPLEKRDEPQALPRAEQTSSVPWPAPVPWCSSSVLAACEEDPWRDPGTPLEGSCGHPKGGSCDVFWRDPVTFLEGSSDVFGGILWPFQGGIL